MNSYYDYYVRERPRPRRVAPVAMIILATTLLGSLLGIFIADRDALSMLKTEAANLIPEEYSSLFANWKASVFGNEDQTAADSQAQTVSEVLSTGLSSFGIIRYSPEADSTRLVFDLEDMELIGTGKLSRPYRIYVDLQDSHREKKPLRKLKTEATLDIDGDLVVSIHISSNESGATRILLDLKQSCDFTYQIPHGSPSRLILKLRPV